MHFTFRPAILVFSIAALSVLSSCGEICDKDEQPQYRLTDPQKSWAAPYVENTEWRFRNAAGYERRFRVVKVQDEQVGEGGGKNRPCPTHYRQKVIATLERMDSVSLTHESVYSLNISAKINDGDKPFTAAIGWGSVGFGLAIDELENGQTVLGSRCERIPQLTAGGRTYQDVLKSTSFLGSSGTLSRPTMAEHIYMTKADGVIRVEERGGTVWNRQ